MGRVYALEKYAGALYAAGDVSGGPGGDGIARYDGASWSRLGSGLANANGNPATGFALGVHDDGQGARLYVGGIFDTAGGTPAAGIASWDGAFWRALPPGLDAVAAPLVRALGSFDDGGGPGLFAGGTFSRAGRTVADKAAMWRNGAWSRLADGAGISGTVSAVCAHDDGSGRALFASGSFDTAGTTLAKGIARWNGATWRALGDPLDSDGFAYALLAADLGAGPKLVAGGAFTRIGGVAAAGIASWDGTSWSPLGSGVDGFVEGLAVFDDGSGPSLYVGGQFTLAGGVAASNVARWDGSNWSALGSGTDHQVHDLETFDDGTGAALYACGNFNSAGGIPVVRVARWNGSSWSAVGNEIVDGSGQMFDLQAFDDGTGAQLYLAGLAILGSDLVRVVRWDGATWTAAGVPPTNNVYSLTVFHDGNGPRLCTPDAPLTGNTLTRIRAFDGVFDVWHTLPGTIEGGVSALVAYDLENDGVPDLYAGGGFRAAGGEPAANFTRFRSCGTEGSVECAGNGSFGVCPCGNTGAIDHGCANSVHAEGARLSSDGLASLARDTLVLAAEGMTGTFAIFAQGTTIAGSTGVPFDDGLLCVAGTVQRLGSASIAGASASLPSAGGTRLSQLGGVTAPGQTRIYQTIYRNQAAFCTSGSANTTNGLSITWSL